MINYYSDVRFTQRIHKAINHYNGGSARYVMDDRGTLGVSFNLPLPVVNAIELAIEAGERWDRCSPTKIKHYLKESGE